MEDVITYGLLALYGAFIVLDLARPARRFPLVRRWRAKGLFFFVSSVALSVMLPTLWDAHFAEYRLIDASGLGTVGGAIVGLLALQLGIYWWHRTMHRTDWLFRHFHQMHHSAERVDIFGAWYFHPLDVAGFALIGSLSLVLVVGVAPEAAMIASGFATFCTMFQHTNLRTPRWLGYFITRPESHSIHHERGVHAYNYADIPFWDIVFGTFCNPATWDGEAGFYDGASHRVAEMAIGRDVSAPEELEPPPSSVQPQVA